jgi:type VI protein secretion system component VasK
VDPSRQAQITSVLRVLISLALGWAVGKGLITAEQVGPVTQTIIDAVMIGIVPLVILAWGIISNRKSALIAKVASMVDVKKVVAAPHIADESLSDHPKVTSR